MNASLLRLALVTLALTGLAACKPDAPPTDEPPAPKAVAAENTELRDAIRQPIDQAKKVEGTVQEAADRNQAAIDAASQ